MSDKILFTSDYCEGAHPRIMERLLETNMDQTVGYGVDPYCERAREAVRKACARPDADVHFLVGGTQTNTTVITSILKPYQGVIAPVTGHISIHETGAIEHGGHKVLSIPGKDGKLTAQQVAETIEGHYNDPDHEHIVQPGMVYISFPTELGTIYSREELTAISDVCRRFDVPLFIDGARLGYGLMAPGCDLTLPDIARLASVFYIGGTKQGALFGEAVVIIDQRLKKNFRYFIKQGGGMLAKGRLLGLQFEELLRDNLYFDLARKADNQAFRIRKAFSDKGFPFLVDSPTNQQFPILPNSVLAQLAETFGFEQWRIIDAEHTAVRFCTSWATADANVDVLVDAVGRL